MNNEEHKELMSALRATNRKLDVIQGILLNANAKAISKRDLTEEEIGKALSSVKECNSAIWSDDRDAIRMQLRSAEDRRLNVILAHEFWSSFLECDSDPSSSRCNCFDFIGHKATFSDFIDVLIQDFDYPKVRARTAERLDVIIRKIGSSKVSDRTRSFYRRATGTRFNSFELDHDGFYQMLFGAELDIQIIGSADKYFDICIYRNQFGIATAEEVTESKRIRGSRHRQAVVWRGKV